MKRFLFAGLAIGLLAAALPARAEQITNWLLAEKQCNAREGQNVPPAKRVAGCTAIISGQILPPRKLVPVYLLRGRAYHDMGDDYRAQEDFDKALTIAPDNVAALVTRGVFNLNRNKAKAALADFNHALKVDPNDPGVLGNRALAYKALGETDKAQRAADAAVLADAKAGKPSQDAGDVLANRGIAALQAGHYRKAVTNFDKALAIDPKMERAVFNRALAHQALGERHKALADYASALALKPDDWRVLVNRSAFYVKLGQRQRALADLDAALKIDRHARPALIDRAALYLHARHFAKAVADFSAALHLNRKRPDALWGRCKARAAWGQELDAALADCTAALNLRPKDAAINGTRGLVYYRLGDYAKAIADEDVALARFPRNANLLYIRGIAKVKAGNVHGGEDIAAARAIDPAAVPLTGGPGKP